jgi:hypothetical protein
MFPTLLNPSEPQRQQFPSSKAAPEEYREHRVIAEFAQRGRRSPCQESPPLFRCEPIPQADTEPADAFDPANAGRELWAEQTGIGGLVSDSAHRRESEVDRGRSVVSLFEVNPVAKHDRAVECEARLRAIPGNELLDRMVVRALAAG